MLKAQSQCRATLETLAAIKVGPAIFARQANIAHGPQQVNNGVIGYERAGESDSEKSGLLDAPRSPVTLDTCNDVGKSRSSIN